MARKGIFGLVTAVLLGTASAAAAQGVAGSYLAGRQAGYGNDFAAQADYYTRALARDRGNPQLLESAAQAQLALGAIDRALPIAQKLEADGLKSQVAQMVLVADEAQRKDYDAILKRLDEGRGIGPLVDGLLRGWALMGKGEVSDALAAFDAVGKDRGLSGFAMYHKALALASVGDFEGAEAIFASNAAGPLQMTRRAVIARLEILSQLDQHSDGLVLMDTLFGADLDPGLRVIRDTLTAGKSLPFTQITSPVDGMAEVFFAVAAALNNEADDDYTLLYTRITVALRPDHVDAILLSANLLDDLGQYDLAVEAYRGVPVDHPSFHAAELGRAEALRQSGRVDAAGEVLEQLAKTHAELPVVHVTLGDLMRQQDRYADAVKAYDKAMSLYAAEDTSQWFIYYARAISHERLDEWPQAEADFRKALDLNPEQPQILNYLGYSMVEKNINLDEALEMIERAVAARPDSGYIVDSLGWAQFRLGRYEDAAKNMERAAELMPVDPIVNDHLGDALWAVGRKLEARFQWRRALSFKPEAKDEARIRRKLEVGLDAVLTEEGAPPLRVVDGNN